MCDHNLFNAYKNSPEIIRAAIHIHIQISHYFHLKSQKLMTLIFIIISRQENKHNLDLAECCTSFILKDYNLFRIILFSSINILSDTSFRSSK